MLVFLKKSFYAYSKNLAGFIWATLVYCLLYLISIFGGIGLFLIYFMIASALNFSIFENIAVTGVFGLISLIFTYYFANAFYGGLLIAYRRASTTNQKPSLALIYEQSIRCAPKMFLLALLRDFLWVVPMIILLAIRFLLFPTVGLMSYVATIGTLFMFFLTHLIFKPIMIYSSAYDFSISDSFRKGLRLIKNKPLDYLGIYALYSVAYLIKQIPILNVLVLFVINPILLSGMVFLSDKSNSG